MINLLPYDVKKQTKSARVNVILIKYIIIMILALAFLGLAVVTAYFIIDNNKVESTDIIKTSNNSQDPAGQFRSDLANARIMLNQRLSYSELLTTLGTSLPEGAVLDSLTLSDTSIGVPISLQVKVKSADIEPQLKARLATAYFSVYQLVSSNPNPDGSSAYPQILNINLTFNKAAN